MLDIKRPLPVVAAAVVVAGFVIESHYSAERATGSAFDYKLIVPCSSHFLVVMSVSIYLLNNY